MKRFYLCITVCFMCTFFLALSVPTWAAADEKEVVMMGVGITEDAAKRQAYKSAIQSVIGSMVLSQTIVENERLVQDKILSHSDGYIVKAEQVGSTRQLEGNLLEVTMRVTVKSTQLKAKLQAENITVANLDGQSLFAQSVTKEETAKDAASIIKEKLAGLPASVLTAEADVQGSTQKKLEHGLVELTVPVNLLVNRNNYRTLTTEIKKTLQQLGYTGKAMQLPLSIGNTYKPYDSHISLSEFMDAYGKKIQKDEYSKHAVIVIGEGIQTSSNSLRTTGYYVPKEAALAFNHEGFFTLVVELLDANGHVIIEQTWGNSEESRKQWLKFNKKDPPSLKYNADASIVRATDPQAKENSGEFAAIGYMLPSPFIASINSYTDFYSGAAATLPIVFELSAGELQKVTSVKCTVRDF